MRKLGKTYYITLTAKRKNAVRHIHMSVKSDNVDDAIAIADSLNEGNPRYIYNVYTANWELIK